MTSADSTICRKGSSRGDVEGSANHQTTENGTRATNLIAKKVLPVLLRDMVWQRFENSDGESDVSGSRGIDVLPNQSLETMALAVTSSAAQKPRQPKPCLTIER